MTQMAAVRWERDLRDRAIPTAILDAAPESPYGYPAEPFRRRAMQARSGPLTPTAVRAMEALPDGGSVLDVGCGSGATSLALAERAGLVVGVDTSTDMLATFRDAVSDAGAEVDTVPGVWPEVAGDAPTCDVVVCGHVFYNVWDVPAFATALHEHATGRVVAELTDRHPWAWMNDLWRRFHDVRFPDGPSAALAAEVLREAGFEPKRDERTSTEHGGFERREDAIALVRRRLCLGVDRDREVEAALGDRLAQGEDGSWSAGPREQTVVTLWWDVAA